MEKLGWPLAISILAIAVTLIYFNERGIKGLDKASPVIVGMFTNLQSKEDSKLKSAPHTLVSFWTPSLDTAAALKKSETLGKPIPARDRWQENITEADLEAFSVELGSLAGVSGYRRFAEVGKGRTFEKPGFWWQVTTGPDFRIDTLRSAYRSMCHCDDMYIEIIAASESKYEQVIAASSSDTSKGK